MPALAERFFVLGQLNDGDEVPILGRARRGDDTWLAIPGVGWVSDDPAWLELDRDAVRDVPDPSRVLAAVAPPHPADVRTGIGIIDEVIEAVLGGDVDAVVAQVRLTTFECWTPTAIGGPPSCAPGEPDGTPVEALPGLHCEGGYAREPVDRSVQAWLAGPGTLKLYAVTEGSFADWDVRYAAVFVFETTGQERIAWIGPQGGITALGWGCVSIIPQGTGCAPPLPQAASFCRRRCPRRWSQRLPSRRVRAASPSLAATSRST